MENIMEGKYGECQLHGITFDYFANKRSIKLYNQIGLVCPFCKIEELLKKE